MAAGLHWNGEAIAKQIRKELWERIQRAVVTFHTILLGVLNVHNPPPYVTPSKPGEPPRKRTGFLQSNVIRELKEDLLAGRVGVLADAIYGLWLEIGTKRMKARPFIFATLKRLMPQLRAIVGLGNA